MSTELVEVQDGQIYQGYDTLAAVQFCTPSYLGCSACIGASVISGYVALTITLNTPFGNVSKTFKITQGGSFTWQPFSKAKVVITINNFGQQGNTFSFDAGIQVCIDIPFFGWKCAGYSHHFSIPVLALKAEALSDHDTAALFAMHALVQNQSSCNCH